jgi:hypothetical protein
LAFLSQDLYFSNCGLVLLQYTLAKAFTILFIGFSYVVFIHMWEPQQHFFPKSHPFLRLSGAHYFIELLYAALFQGCTRKGFLAWQCFLLCLRCVQGCFLRRFCENTASRRNFLGMVQNCGVRFCSDVIAISLIRCHCPSSLKSTLNTEEFL